jgi:hypothetical protein
MLNENEEMIEDGTWEVAKFRRTSDETKLGPQFHPGTPVALK